MYTKTLKLQNHESVAVIDKKTGEFKEVKQRPNNIPEGGSLQKFEAFSKVNDKAIAFLESVLTNEEMGIVFKMIKRAAYETNVMLPLNNETSYRELAEEFNIGKNKVDKIFGKLFKLGVYAQIKVANGPYSEYWTLNPYISFKGRIISESIKVYFDKTVIATAVQ
jgi:hypothetical protein